MLQGAAWWEREEGFWVSKTDHATKDTVRLSHHSPLMQLELSPEKLEAAGPTAQSGDVPIHINKSSENLKNLETCSSEKCNSQSTLSRCLGPACPPKMLNKLWGKAIRSPEILAALGSCCLCGSHASGS